MDRTNFTIKKWAESDRPREKLLGKGRTSLSDAELIGILIGSGTKNKSAVDLARQILVSVDHDLNELAKLSIKELRKFKGMGEAKAVSIVSALELGRRRKETSIQKKPRIGSPKDAYEFMKPELLDQEKEEFWIILLNRAHFVIRKVLISSGGISGTAVDPKLIFKQALDQLASGIILVHNHPSGNLNPSDADHNITRRLTDVGKFLELPIVDHIIFGNNGYYSFKDENHL